MKIMVKSSITDTNQIRLNFKAYCSSVGATIINKLKKIYNVMAGNSVVKTEGGLTLG